MLKNILKKIDLTQPDAIKKSLVPTISDHRQ